MVDEFGLEVVGQPAQEDEFGLKPVKSVGDSTAIKPGKTFTPRERLTFTGELLGGLKDVGTGLSRFVTDPYAILGLRDPGPGELLPQETTTPQMQTLSGILRLAGSPFARLQNPTAALGDMVEQGVSAVTGSEKIGHGAGDMAAFGGDLASALLLGKVANVVKPLVKRNAGRLMSPRQKAESLSEDLAHTIKESDIRQSNITSGTEAATESVQSIADAAKMDLPTATDLRRRFAPNAPLGKEAGKGYQAGFNTKFEEAKKTFEDLYGPLKEEAASLPTSATNFVEAGGKLSEGTGITGSSLTKPEAVAGRIPKIAQSIDDLEADALRRISEAPVGQRGNVFQELMQPSKVPAENATVADLINERQRIAAAKRVMKDDNSRRQAQQLIDGLDADIAAGNPDLAKRYGAVNERFKNEYAPYFSRGAVTREIAQGTPEAVVDSIYRPTVSASGKTLKNKSVESMARAKELIKDPAQWEQINKSFINKGIEHAFEEGAFNPDRARKWWTSYKDPAGTGNEVLRKGLGEAAFKDIDSVFTQLGNSKARSLDEFAKEAIKNFEKQGKELMKGEKLRVKTITDEIERRVEATLGKPSTFTKRLESIGSGVFVSGTMGTIMGSASGLKRSVGGMAIALSARQLGELIAFTKGRSALKALVRSAPGTVEGMAAVKTVQALLQSKGEE